jgi:hypothetical protein
MILKQVPEWIDDVTSWINHLHMHVLKAVRLSFSVNSNTSHGGDGLSRTDLIRFFH